MSDIVHTWHIYRVIHACMVHTYALLDIQIKEGLHVKLTIFAKTRAETSAMVPLEVERHWQPVR